MSDDRNNKGMSYDAVFAYLGDFSKQYKSASEGERARLLKNNTGPLFMQIYGAFKLGLELPEEVKQDYVQAIEEWMREPDTQQGIGLFLSPEKNWKSVINQQTREAMYDRLFEIDAAKQSLIDEGKYEQLLADLESYDWRTEETDPNTRHLCWAAELSRLPRTKRIRELLRERFGEEYKWGKEVASVNKGYLRYLQKRGYVST